MRNEEKNKPCKPAKRGINDHIQNVEHSVTQNQWIVYVGDQNKGSLRGSKTNLF